MSNQDSSIVDIAVIGGGINGCGIARDAAGRGWSVREWVRTAADVVWRRSKLGLRMTKEEIADVDAALASILLHQDRAA